MNSNPRGHRFRHGHAGGGAHQHESRPETCEHCTSRTGSPGSHSPKPTSDRGCAKTPTTTRQTTQTVQFSREPRQSCDLYTRNLRRTGESISTQTCSFRPSKVKCGNTSQTQNLTRKLEAAARVVCQLAPQADELADGDAPGALPPDTHEAAKLELPDSARKTAIPDSLVKPHPCTAGLEERHCSSDRDPTIQEGTSRRGRINHPSAGSPLADEQTNNNTVLRRAHCNPSRLVNLPATVWNDKPNIFRSTRDDGFGEPAVSKTPCQSEGTQCWWVFLAAWRIVLL